jgi:hypothetical protein
VHEMELERIIFDLQEQVAVLVEDPDLDDGGEDLSKSTTVDNELDVHCP